MHTTRSSDKKSPLIRRESRHSRLHFYFLYFLLVTGGAKTMGTDGFIFLPAELILPALVGFHAPADTALHGHLIYFHESPAFY